MAQTLGPYTRGNPLGTLPFGELVEATHAARREPLALLTFADELARDQRLRGLLRLEVARAGGLRHPAIARPIEVAEHDGRLYVVYEHPPGKPLSRWIDDGTGLSAETTMTIVRQLADGLDAAHVRRLAQVMLERTGGDPAGEIAPDIQAVLDRQGLADPSARFRTCADFAAALAEAVARPAAASPVTTPPAATPSAATEPIRPPEPSQTAEPTVRARRTPTKKRPPQELAHPEPAASELRPSRLTRLSTTPAMRASLDAAFAGAVSRAILVGTLPLILLIVFLFQQWIILAIAAVIAAFWLDVPSALTSAVCLWRARRDPEIVQAYAPVRVVEKSTTRRQATTTTYEIEIGSYDTFEIDKATFAGIALASPAADPESMVESGWGPRTRSDTFSLQRAYVTYSRTGQRILEIADQDGELIYADSAYAGEDADQ